MQSVINFLFRTPRSKLATFRRFGGYFNYRSMVNGSKQMDICSWKLPPISSEPSELPIYFLTGRKYLYQTLFCIQSLIKASGARFKFILIDDGSFDKQLIERISQQLPGAQIITSTQIGQNLKKLLPEAHYPHLHQKRAVYPHIKKLTDIHTLPDGSWKLVLDSDMLFWREPADIINWLDDPRQPLHMVDCVEAYGYSRKLMETLSGSTIKPSLNVGAIGLKSEHIDWDKLESWVKTLEEREGTSYYLEQALSAMLIGSADSVVLKADEYIVNPAKDQIKNKSGILHHYVDLSKEGYFKQAWKHFLPNDIR